MNDIAFMCCFYIRFVGNYSFFHCDLGYENFFEIIFHKQNMHVKIESILQHIFVITMLKTMMDILFQI